MDIATGAERIAYSGQELYKFIGFGPHGLYLVHHSSPPTDYVDRLYRLDPAGGAPTLVFGGDRDLGLSGGWVSISDGAAWGMDFHTTSSDYSFSIVRLDLSTGQITEWFEGRSNEYVWPLGTDQKHRLYVQDFINGLLWRVDAPMAPIPLPNPGPIMRGDFNSIFVSDSHGAWFAGGDGVWLYPDSGPPQHFSVGPLGATPAGPCL